ncbi:hypothetical protein [[Phormidium] sp. ETS-05]|nr:hypothetical protein [[Phormidium] sp. ETS-05]
MQPSQRQICTDNTILKAQLINKDVIDKYLWKIYKVRYGLEAKNQYLR